jgi:WD40 repeat protein
MIIILTYLSVFEEEESEEYFSNLLMKITCISSNSDKNLKISDVCWNSTGNTLAISYSIDNHIGPCSHTGKIDFFKFSNISESKTFKEKITIETNSCIKSIDSHPKYPSIFTSSCFIGEIYLIDVSENKDVDQIQCISKVDSYFHKECVNLVKWIKFEDGNYYILSLSEEGRLLIWNPEDKLTYPSLGFSLKFKIGKNSYPINPISMGVDLFESFNFVIGTLDGNIYKCSFAKPDENIHEYIFSQSSGTVWRRAVRQLISNMNDNDVIEMKNYMDKFCKDKNIMDLNVDEFFKLKPNVAKLYKNALKSNFEKHISMVTSVEFSPFFKNLFLTSSFDGSLRIYHQSLHVI